ncbi:MAG: DUF4962 domain-containing protein [Planctomycetota bacterium]|nr:DUF4962 domain-containing protein [Planctomycetota bacterium]MDA1178695.1 DUF4962 domain-containing protein [Planctomycetota bacterium]
MPNFRKCSIYFLFAFCFGIPINLRAAAESPPSTSLGHPRLYFTEADLPTLRTKRLQDPRAASIWRNVARTADWCAQQPPRTEWIPTLKDDPQFENLYDRFYAAMHDLAIVEHLALASALSEPGDDRYFEPARAWTLAAAAVWKQETTNPPDASKAYAVLRIMKGLAVAYDVLYSRLTETERQTVRDALTSVTTSYYEFFLDPTVAGAGYNKHHGSVDAPPIGIVALALLGEVPQASNWLDLVIQKHIDYLIPNALTPSGTNDQSSNFWASTLHYRILFFDAMRRVTGRDLFQEYPQALPGRIALAAIAGKQSADLEYNEEQRSVLCGPSYGQINYWSPVLVFLARQQQRPIYQYLSSWDESLGSIQHTRFITPTRKEELLFCLGPFAYVWYDPRVPAEIEPDLPRAFEFPEPEVNEAYLRDTFQPGGCVVAFKKGGLVVHAGGRPVLVDLLKTADANHPTPPSDEMLVTDDGYHAMIRAVGPASTGLGEQRISLYRPGRLSIQRTTTEPLTWWYSGDPVRNGSSFTWDNGICVTISRGKIDHIDPQGHKDIKTHYGGMQYADPHPFTYATIEVHPENGQIHIDVLDNSHTRR